MKGILKKIYLKSFKAKATGKEFKKLVYECDVKYEDNTVKSLRGDYSEEFARKYFKYCETTTKEMVGKEVECVVAKRAYTNDKGEERTINFIKYMNILDKDGKAIIMPKENADEELDF